MEPNERQSLLPGNRSPVTTSRPFVDDGSSGLLNSSSYTPPSMFPTDLANGTMRRGSLTPSLQIHIGSEIMTNDSAVQQGYDTLSDSDSRPKTKTDNTTAPVPVVSTVNVWSRKFFYNGNA